MKCHWELHAYREVEACVSLCLAEGQDIPSIQRGIIIGHDHAYGSWVPEYKPQLWDGGSILDDGTYLAVMDGVPELKKF